MDRELGKQYVLSLSYGKDSMACLGAIAELGLPLDRIITVDVWATQDIPADLPPMNDFKEYADKIILEKYGIQVEHLCSMKNGKKWSYEDEFYLKRKTGQFTDKITGFPMIRGPWCNDRLKMRPIHALETELKKAGNVIQYVGIAEDEPERLKRLDGISKISPLHLIGWTEADAKQWCNDNALLSPIYTDTCTRGGCWFCHNAGIQEQRELRHNYPNLWNLLLKWDADSPVVWHADGHTVHDFDRRFALEDAGLIPTDKRFRWKMLDESNHINSKIDNH